MWICNSPKIEKCLTFDKSASNKFENVKFHSRQKGILYKKGDPVPAEWLTVYPSDHFEKRVFDSDCVSFGDSLFKIALDPDSAFISLDSEIEEKRNNSRINYIGPVFDSRTWGMFLAKSGLDVEVERYHKE